MGKDRLLSLPDGETEPERANWSQYIFDNLAELDELELAAPGRWQENKPPRLRVARRRSVSAERIAHALAYSRYAEQNYHTVMRQQDDAEPLPYQVGIPSDVVGASALRIPGVRIPRRRDLFRAATVREIDTIQALTVGNVVFQLELPLETVLLTMTPGPLRQAVARRLARALAELVSQTHPAARFIAHLCEGDFNKGPQKALGHPSTLEPIVVMANALLETWPSGRAPLERIHIPIAYGEYPPPLKPAYYRPLSTLRLSPATRLVAGLAHESQSRQEQATALGLVEDHAQRNVDIAAACGLGRRSLEGATVVAQRTVDLASCP